MKQIWMWIALRALGCTFSPARGSVVVGEQAKLTYRTIDGKTIDIEKLHGHIVIVDFWATWCGPCMAEAGHMVDINKKYGDKGLVMLGVSLDADKAAMLAVCRAKGFTWPQYFDGKGWGNLLFKQWGTNGIPFTVLINPNGKVIFANQPGNGLDAAIEQTFKLTPPHVVEPAVLAEANRMLDQVEEKLTAHDANGALRLMSKIPTEARADGEFAARAKAAQTNLQATADGMLKEADALIDGSKYREAVIQLKLVADGLPGMPEAIKARKKLLELNGKPEVRAIMAQAEKEQWQADRNARAAQMLAAAQSLQSEKKDEQAYAGFKALCVDYYDTPAGQAAAIEKKKYETAHPEMVTDFNEEAGATKAKAALSMAASYQRSGRTDLARAKYQGVIDLYPGTSYAKTAATELARLANP